MRKRKELVEELDNLFDKVWWNRHMYYRHQIEEGFEPEPKTVTDSKSWEDIKLMADSMVAKYGIEKLELQDFDWGMLNGRLAMLRWVLGDEYCNLDT